MIKQPSITNFFKKSINKDLPLKQDQKIQQDTQNHKETKIQQFQQQNEQNEQKQNELIQNLQQNEQKQILQQNVQQNNIQQQQPDKYLEKKFSEFQVKKTKKKIITSSEEEYLPDQNDENDSDNEYKKKIKNKFIDDDDDFSENEKKTKQNFIDDDLDFSDNERQQKNSKKPAQNTKKQSLISQKDKSAKQSDINNRKNLTDKNLDDKSQEFSESVPYFALPENLKDKNGYAPSSPYYNPTSLYVPQKEYKNMTPCMQQYWEIKSDNFDCIIFFKLGKFYELFYDDAIVGNKYLDLNWMKNKMHVGFPEKSLDKYSEQLIKFGFKVCIVEQTESVKEMEERVLIDKKNSIKSNKTLQRQPVDIRTQGTFMGEFDFQSKYLISFKFGQNQIGFSALESQSNVITLGCLNDDENYTQFKTLLAQFKPQEVIIIHDQTPIDIVKILKSGYSKPQISYMSNSKNEWSKSVSYHHLEESQQNILQDNENYVDISLESLSGLYSYLKKILIFEKILQTARYEKYDYKTKVQNSMILDNQAIQHLEILETQDFKVEGSLFSYIDKTVSKFGKRLLKKWILSPLFNIDQINQRYDAIEDLQKNQNVRDKFRKTLQKLPDLQRMTTKIYQYSVRQQKFSQYQDINGQRLKEFQQLLNHFQETQKMMDECFEDGQFRDRISLLLDKQQGYLPQISGVIEKLKEKINWRGGNQEIVFPAYGVMPEYDKTKILNKEIQQELQEYLISIRKQFNDNTIEYHCPLIGKFNFRYQLEIPERYVKGNLKPNNFEFVSQKKGYQRFLTSEIKELTQRLEDSEILIKNQILEFTIVLFTYFREQYRVWDQFINILSELDCLCSLSLVSFSGNYMSRPIIDFSNNIEIQQLRHPCFNDSFIPNDIILNQNKIMLLTGPNMGGKSTTLRMTCISAILCQIGCYIPAKSGRIGLVDRIFTRIGASDNLHQGKSTFYIEMEETLNIVKHGTQHSLTILDELGRGTSTFDGLAIAFAVMKYLDQSIKCRTLFATHYHTLSEEFSHNDNISNHHMKCLYDNDKIIFLYQLKLGQTESSFGIKVAKMVGLPQQIIEYAEDKCKEFEKKFNYQSTQQTEQLYQQYLKINGFV